MLTARTATLQCTITEHTVVRYMLLCTTTVRALTPCIRTLTTSWLLYNVCITLTVGSKLDG
jgi:hypothetical protein